MRYRINPQDFTLEDLAKFMHAWKWTARIILKSMIRQGTVSEISEGHYHFISLPRLGENPGRKVISDYRYPCMEVCEHCEHPWLAHEDGECGHYGDDGSICGCTRLEDRMPNDE